VAEPVVDVLEVVEVDHHQAAGLARAAGAGHFDLELDGEEALVVKAGEIVAEAERFELPVLVRARQASDEVSPGRRRGPAVPARIPGRPVKGLRPGSEGLGRGAFPVESRPSRPALTRMSARVRPPSIYNALILMIFLISGVTAWLWGRHCGMAIKLSGLHYRSCPCAMTGFQYVEQEGCPQGIRTFGGAGLSERAEIKKGTNGAISLFAFLDPLPVP
jgi:hypothetical protein